MRNLFLLIISLLVATTGTAQFLPERVTGAAGVPGPRTRSPLNSLGRAGGAGRTILTDVYGNQRFAYYTNVNLTPIAFIPTPTGNTSNLSEFVVDPTGNAWYIDWQGDAMPFGGSSPSTCDEDWLKISSNGCPESIYDSLYKYNYAAIGARRVWPGATLFLCDSTITSPRANAVILGERSAGIGLKIFSSGDSVWTSYRQAGGESNVYLGLNTTSWNVRAAAGTNPAFPSSPFSSHFSIYPALDVVRFWKYPSSRNDTTSITNVLTTDPQGYARSHPLSEVITAGGGIYSEGQGIDITSNVINLGAPDSLTSLITSRRYLNAQNNAASLRIHGARSASFIGPTFPNPYLDIVNINSTDGPGASIRFFEKTSGGSLVGGGRIYSYADGGDGGIGIYTPGLKLQATDGPATIQASNNIQLAADGQMIASGDSVMLSTLETVTKVPFLVGYNIANALKKIAGSSNGQVMTWQNGGWQALTPGSPPAGSGGIYGGSGTAFNGGTANAPNFTFRAFNPSGDDFHSGLKFGYSVNPVDGSFSGPGDGLLAIYGGYSSNQRSFINLNGEDGSMQIGLTYFPNQRSYFDITTGTGAFRFTDTRTLTRGIQYTANYHAGYDLRSLVDKEYVDLAVLAATGLTNWTEAFGGSGALATSSFLAKNAGQANINAALLPKGTGAIQANVPDNTAAGGNARGNGAVDWQLARSLAGQVASGIRSALLGGASNQAGGDYSSWMGGTSNTAGGENAGGVGGANNISSGQYSFVGGGNTNELGGSNTAAFGAQNTGTGDYSIAYGRGGFAGLYGAATHGAGTFPGTAGLGDAQRVELVMRREFTGTAQTELFLDGASLRASLDGLTQTTNVALTCQIQFIAYCVNKGNGGVNTNEVYSTTAVSTVKMVGTTTSLVGTNTTLATAADTNMGTASLAVQADDTNDAVAIKWTPPAGAGSTSQWKTVAVVNLTVLGN